MSKRDELIEKYAADIKSKFGQDPDMDLLTKVAEDLALPSIMWMHPKYPVPMKRNWKR